MEAVCGRCREIDGRGTYVRESEKGQKNNNDGLERPTPRNARP